MHRFLACTRRRPSTRRRCPTKTSAYCLHSDLRVAYGCHVDDNSLTRFCQLHHDFERPGLLESRRAVQPSPVKIPQMGSRGRTTHEILRKSTKALSEVKVNTIVMSQRFCFLFFLALVALTSLSRLQSIDSSTSTPSF